MEEKENKTNEEVLEKEQMNNGVDLKQQEIDDLTDRYKRILAEFENHKKRSQKEREGLYNSILGDVVEVILPVLDNLENALQVETKDEEVLKSKGVEEIKALGETFDPALHEAITSVQDESKGEKEIVQEYRKGYKIGYKVIRHSMVVVAN